MKIKELKMANSEYTITEMCEVFELNQSTYFDQIKEKELAGKKKKIISTLKQTAQVSKNTYGRR